jgi:isomerase DpgB
MLRSLSSPEIRLEIDGSGSLSPSLVTDIDAICDRIEQAGQSAIAMIHVAGAQDAAPNQCWPGEFGGLDIHLITKWERALRRVERLGGATIGVAEGFCGGVALEMLLATDYRLAGTDLRICLRGPAGEVWPGMSVYRLANQVGVAQARPHVLFGAEMTAARAHALGLIDSVVDNLPAAVSGFMKSLDGSAMSELAVRRRLLLEAPSATFEDALGAHLAACDRLMRRHRQ